MDINTTSTITKPTETSTHSSSTATAAKESSSSFKDELETAKTQDTKDAENAKAVESKNAQNTQKNTEEKNAQEITKEQLKAEKDKNEENLENKRVSDSLNELNSKIAALNDIKNGYISKTHNWESKIDDKTSDKTDYCKTIKMDNNDIKFFVNLVENQQMSAHNVQLNNTNLNNAFSEIKTKTTQETVQVSATLLDAINESARTNKPFRVDFGNDIAVIMKVNKDGNLSANFIPGSAAVENYLRNNIEGLRQSFDEQNLPYDQLSYSNQQNKEQNRNKNKENENE